MMVMWWWVPLAFVIGIIIGLSVPGPVRRGEEPFTDEGRRRVGSNPNPPVWDPEDGADNPMPRRPVATPPPPRERDRQPGAIHLHLNASISEKDVEAVRALVDVLNTGQRAYGEFTMGYRHPDPDVGKYADPTEPRNDA
jgi:hypothetical protein